MDPDEFDRLEKEAQHDLSQTPPFDAGGSSRDDAAEPDSDQQFSSAPPDAPAKDTNNDETEFYNEGVDHDNDDPEEFDTPDVDSYEDPAKQ